MKKTKLLLSSLTLLAATLASCGRTSSEPVSEQPSNTDPVTSEPVTSEPVSEVQVEAGFFGFGGVATYNVTAPTAEKKGTVQTEINFASILLNEDEEILDLRLDVVQIKVGLNEDNTATVVTGKTNGDAGVDTRSKWELLEEYNMSGFSPIGKEWYLQAEAFENFAVGKTVDELLALEGSDTNLTGDKVAVGVTIHVNGFMDAIERAEVNKVAVEDTKDVVIGLGGLGAQATVQSNYTIAGAAFDADGKVVAARMDVYQVPYVIDAAAEGLLAGISLNQTKVQVVASEDVKVGSIKSKHDLLEDYNMNGDKGEWYEQANKITAYMVGKTIEEAFVLGEDNKFSEPAVDVSITANDYMNAFLEADHTAFNARYTA